MRRCHSLLQAILIASALGPCVAEALDLTGKWRFSDRPGLEPLTQVGNSLSFDIYAGTVSAGGAFATYEVSSFIPEIMAAVHGRIMPSENMFDGRFVFFFPPSDLFVSAIVATRCSCDDRNTVNGDGCDAECRVEPCWTCAGDPSVCTPAADGSACEDGSVCTTGETCSGGACGGGAPVSPCTDMTGTWLRHREIPGLGQAFDFETAVIQRGTDVIAGSDVGTIDPTTGAFDLRAVNLNFFCFAAFDPLLGAVAAGDTWTATGTVGQPRPSAPDQCDYFAVTETAIRCGIEGCPSTTTTTSSTTTTSTSTSTTTLPGACAAAPLPSCRLPVESRKAKLLLADGTPDTDDTVKWSWVKGAATTVAEYGDPLDATDYVACLYDGASVLRMTLRAPAGGTCGAAPCWRAKRNGKGFAYSDRERTPDGVRKIVLRPGSAGKAKITLSARGDQIPLPPLGPGALLLPLRVQKQGNGLCWEAVYSTPQEHSTAKFKARAD